MKQIKLDKIIRGMSDPARADIGSKCVGGGGKGGSVAPEGVGSMPWVTFYDDTFAKCSRISEVRKFLMWSIPEKNDGKICYKLEAQGLYQNLLVGSLSNEGIRQRHEQ